MVVQLDRQRRQMRRQARITICSWAWLLRHYQLGHYSCLMRVSYKLLHCHGPPLFLNWYVELVGLLIKRYDSNYMKPLFPALMIACTLGIWQMVIPMMIHHLGFVVPKHFPTCKKRPFWMNMHLKLSQPAPLLNGRQRATCFLEDGIFTKL